MSNNLYLVVSEPYSIKVSPSGLLPDDGVLKEDAIVCELVVAKNRGRARWLAMQHYAEWRDVSFCDWPSLHVFKRDHRIAGEERVLSEEECRNIPSFVWDVKMSFVVG